LYTVVSEKRNDLLELASSISQKILLYPHMNGVFSVHLANMGLQTIAVECGKMECQTSLFGALQAIERLFTYYSRKLTNTSVRIQTHVLYQNPYIVKIKPSLTFSTDGSPEQVMIRTDIEQLNFQQVPKNALIAKTNLKGLPFSVHYGKKNHADEWLNIKNGEVRLKRAATILMATSDHSNIRKDVLLYLADKS